MTHLPVALFNYEHGGRTGPGRYTLQPLCQVMAELPEAPAIIVLCEAKEYGYWGNMALLAAAHALSDRLGRNYDTRLGWIDRGDHGPAIFYDSQVLSLLYWGDNHPTVSDARRNLARLRLRRRGTIELQTVIRHYTFRSGATRRQEAELDDVYGEDPIPTLLAGDLNGTASGLHLPQRRWEEEPSYRLRSRKGKRLESGRWVADTDALDHLIGRWEGSLHEGRRLDGSGFHAVAELAYRTGTPAGAAFRATVNEGVNAGGGLLIDWLLANNALAGAYVPGSYMVHVPEGEAREDFPSDHRAVFAAFEL